MSAAPLSTPDQSGIAAPAAPGALGVPVQAAEAQTYLGALRIWVAQRRADLGEVDRALLRLSPAEQSSITTDLTVALTFWKAVSDRLTLLETTFDGGRVGPRRGGAALDAHPRPSRLEHDRAPRRCRRAGRSR